MSDKNNLIEIRLFDDLIQFCGCINKTEREILRYYVCQKYGRYCYVDPWLAHADFAQTPSATTVTRLTTLVC